MVTHLSGTPLESSSLGTAERSRAAYDLGAFMARLHTVHGSRFGYPNADTGIVGDTWALAYGRMVSALLADAARTGTDLPADEIRAAVAANLPVLDVVTTPSLVHTDLWPGNLFVSPSGSLVGVIDPERAIWADPLYDLVGGDQMSVGAVDPVLLEGYASVAGVPFDLTDPGTATRLNLYRLTMTLITITEIVPRRFSGDWLVGYRATLWGNLRTLLDRLQATGFSAS